MTSNDPHESVYYTPLTSPTSQETPGNALSPDANQKKAFLLNQSGKRQHPPMISRNSSYQHEHISRSTQQPQLASNMPDTSNDHIVSELSKLAYPKEIIDSLQSNNVTGLSVAMMTTGDLKEMGINTLKTRIQLLSDLSTITGITPGLQGFINSDSNCDKCEKLEIQFSKLKEELLPLLKEVKDRKPLPSPHQQVSLKQPQNGTLPAPRKALQQTQSASSKNDTLKQLRAKTEDPCYKILQAAMRSHGLNKDDWMKYVLVIVYGGDKERVMGYDERPVAVFKELNELGLNPNMMLRQVDEAADDNIDTPGGRL